MVKIIGGKTFEASTSASIPNNSLFLDDSDNVIKQKNNSGTVSELGGSSSFVLREVDDTNSLAMSASGGSQNVTTTFEFAALASANVQNYVEIDITGYSDVIAYVGATAYVQIKIETKEIAGSYSDSMAYQTLAYASLTGANTSTPSVKSGGSLKYIHTPSAGEKSAGLQVRVTINGVTGANGGCHAIYTNTQNSIKSY